MEGKHIAFLVESADGHINPTLGIARALLSAGVRISYAVAERFVPRVRATGAEALVYNPLDYRLFFSEERNTGMRASTAGVRAVQPSWAEFTKQETQVAIPQLQALYDRKRPDLIIYDLRCLAGRSVAKEWKIPKIEHSPITIGGEDKDFLHHSYDENLVIVSLPRLFQRRAETLDQRFHFMGPFFDNPLVPSEGRTNARSTILVSGPTIGVPTVDRFHLAVEAFEGCEHPVVLSIGERLDPALLPVLPRGFEVNQLRSQLEMLESAALFVSHAGQISVLEAMYRGVPILALPLPHPLYESIAERVTELGIGLHLRQSEVSVARVRECARTLLDDGGFLQRARRVQQCMVHESKPSDAVELIREFLTP